MSAKVKHDTIDAALAAAVQAMPPVAKDARNDQQKFNYRSIEDIVAAGRQALAAEGVSVSCAAIDDVAYEGVTSRGGGSGYRCTLLATWRFGISREEFVLVPYPGEAIDYGDKATTKATQMSYKYAITTTLMVTSADSPDNDGAGHDLAPEPELSEAEKDRLATNQLRFDILALVGGDKEEAAGLYATLLAEEGLAPDDTLSGPQRAIILQRAEDVVGATSEYTE